MKLPFPTIDQSTEQNVYALRETLFRVFEELAFPHYVAGGAWEYLQARYTEPGRFYHTLGHLVDMFNAAAQLEEELTPAEALAILYHDVIYEVGADDNEERSSCVLLELYQGLGCVHTVQACSGIIDVAVQIVSDTSQFLDKELPMSAAHSLLVMDLDLSYFAKPYELFDMTNQLVCMELGIEHEKHAAFLMKFTEREHIYRTKAARDAWEWDARANISCYNREAGL